MSVRVFAAHLGVAVSSVTNWERRGERIRLRGETQEILDRDLSRASEDVRQRFEIAVEGAALPFATAGSERVAIAAERRQSSGRMGLVIGSDGPDDNAVLAASELWHVDIGEATPLAVLPIDSSVWQRAALGWVVRERGAPSREDDARPRVGAGDIAAVRATTVAFAGLDGQFGGAHARRALVQYLHGDLVPMLRSRYTEGTGRELFSAAAEATLLAAWMTYDAGLHGLAQRYFAKALGFAQIADNKLLAASALDAMSHQATYLGRHGEAASLARAARAGSRGRATSTMTAHFHVMEARALAAAGQSTQTLRALGDTVTVYERRRPGDDPDWFAYFDDAELSAEFGHCMRDIDRPAEAVAYAERSLRHGNGSPRSDFFVTMVLAESHLHAGDLEHGCAVAAHALEIGRDLKSARCVEYLRRFRRALTPHAGQPSVNGLAESGHDHPLWAAAG